MARPPAGCGAAKTYTYIPIVYWESCPNRSRLPSTQDGYHRRKTVTIIDAISPERAQVIDATSLEWTQVGQWRGCCIMDKRGEKERISFMTGIRYK